MAPNLGALIGDIVGARLISHAGSLPNLAKYPASTVQILGAEKALFRALKTKGNTPKYGLIFHSSFIGKAHARNKGRISRYLANKCSIASRIDCFSDFQTNACGKKDVLMATRPDTMDANHPFFLEKVHWLLPMAWESLWLLTGVLQWPLSCYCCGCCLWLLACGALW